jgi:hypothetical protein
LAAFPYFGIATSNVSYQLLPNVKTKLSKVSRSITEIESRLNSGIFNPENGFSPSIITPDTKGIFSGYTHLAIIR